MLLQTLLCCAGVRAARVDHIHEGAVINHNVRLVLDMIIRQIGGIVERSTELFHGKSVYRSEGLRICHIRNVEQREVSRTTHAQQRHSTHTFRSNREHAFDAGLERAPTSHVHSVSHRHINGRRLATRQHSVARAVAECGVDVANGRHSNTRAMSQLDLRISRCSETDANQTHQAWIQSTTIVKRRL